MVHYIFFVTPTQSTNIHKVCRPKTNTIYHMHTFGSTKVCIHLGAYKCMHVVYSVGFRKLLV